MTTMRRRRFVPASLFALATIACKRQRAPKVDEVWDESAPLEHTEALASLAPPWPTPTRGRLDSGLITFWLAEPDTPALHVRALLATTDVPADIVTVIAEHLRFELQRRTAREGAQIEVAHGPDRIEIALHGRDTDIGPLLAWLGWVLQPNAPAAALGRARERVLEQASPPSTEEVAIAALTGALLSRKSHALLVDAARLKAIAADALASAWQSTVDPRRAVLVVHAARRADAARAELRKLSETWHGLGRATIEEEAVKRLHPKVPAAGGGKRLLAEPPEPLTLVGGGRGRGELVLGRVVPTPTPGDRSLARLAQRMLQEEIDARLVVSGSQSLFIAHARLSDAAPDRSATELVDALGGAANTRQPAQRLFAAAELWLGARVVQASLAGEDWTALFAEAIDLADRDADIATALARDASTMLQPDPEALRTWQKRWLDPRAGEPGWRWVAAGVDRRDQQTLARIVPLRGASAGSQP